MNIQVKVDNELVPLERCKRGDIVVTDLNAEVPMPLLVIDVHHGKFTATCVELIDFDLVEIALIKLVQPYGKLDVTV